jgi:hypothetical protein
MKWFDVQVTIDDDIFVDGIQGQSPREALINASDNWKDALMIELIRP